MRRMQVQNRTEHAVAASRSPIARKRTTSPDLQSAVTSNSFQKIQPSGVPAALNNSAAALAQSKRIESLQQSPQLLVQREKIEALQLKVSNSILQQQTDPAQRAAQEEELMQGKFQAAQRVEQEELMQGRFETLQRVEEEELMQGKFETAQRVEQEELMQGKFETTQRAEQEELMQGKFDTAQLEEEPAAPNKTGLPDNLKSGIESLSGISMDAVRVHYNSEKPAQLNALAYAQGTSIHVASGQEKHLPHEAWHVVQQAQGRVRPTAEVSGAQINDDKSLESEADTMGAKAMQFKPAKSRSAGK